MAPAAMDRMGLVARQYYYGSNDCYYDRYNNYRCNNSWNSWGRWVLLGAIILFAIFLFFLFSCISARRRRQRGHAPFRGTGWALGRTPPGHAPATYNQQPYYSNQQTTQPYYNNSNNPPPAYGTQNSGYYGRDVELQQPPQAYKPPEGPPPGRM